jgi:hypothetical protein
LVLGLGSHPGSRSNIYFFLGEISDHNILFTDPKEYLKQNGITLIRVNVIKGSILFYKKKFKNKTLTSRYKNDLDLKKTLKICLILC